MIHYLIISDSDLDIKNKNFSQIKTINFGENFKNYFLNLLSSIEEEYICIIRNEEYFNIDIDEQTIIDSFKNNSNVFCFSLYLNKNFNFSNRYNSPTKLVPLSHNEKTLSWDWHRHYFDFGNPFLIESSVFLKSDFKKLSSKCQFNDIDDLEADLQKFNTFPKYIMSCFKDSIIKENNIKETYQP